MKWVAKAQQRLQEHADRLFTQWVDTKPGQKWKAQQNHHRKAWGRKFPPNSPYAYGFHLPQYHHDLIAAVGQGNEEAAKAIMLTHYA
jgi:hypothetical protein